MLTHIHIWILHGLNLLNNIIFNCYKAFVSQMLIKLLAHGKWVVISQILMLTNYVCMLQCVDFIGVVVLVKTVCDEWFNDEQACI